jgi:AraC-like DNA-binding protein
MPTTSSRLLASGPGWRVDDVACTAGPRDRPFEERHEGVCIAAVTRGSFRYRTTQGTALLAPGALLLGNHGHCFECGHEHATGDRCLSFHYMPEFFQAVVRSAPGARRSNFARPQVPPHAATTAIVAAAEAARDDPARLEELALIVAGTVVTASSDVQSLRTPSSRDARRITAALQRIEAAAAQRLSLAALAREAAMSPYHFLRTFRAVVGMTPHQYVLRARLHRAALRLRRSDEEIAAVALAEGFNDLSTFNRRFRRLVGVTPSAWRHTR